MHAAQGHAAGWRHRRRTIASTLIVCKQAHVATRAETQHSVHVGPHTMDGLLNVLFLLEAQVSTLARHISRTGRHDAR